LSILIEFFTHHSPTSAANPRRPFDHGAFWLGNLRKIFLLNTISFRQPKNDAVHKDNDDDEIDTTEQVFQAARKFLDLLPVNDTTF